MLKSYKLESANLLSIFDSQLARRDLAINIYEWKAGSLYNLDNFRGEMVYLLIIHIISVVQCIWQSHKYKLTILNKHRPKILNQWLAKKLYHVFIVKAWVKNVIERVSYLSKIAFHMITYFRPYLLRMKGNVRMTHKQVNWELVSQVVENFWCSKNI